MGKNTQPLRCLSLLLALLLASLRPAPGGDGPPSVMGRAADNVSDVAVNPMPRQQEPGTAALELIDFPWQSLGFSISFLGNRPGYRAMTLTAERRIEVYVKAGEQPKLLAFDIAHELGHVVDLRYNDEARRSEWRRRRGIDPGTAWFGCSACSDYSTPAGDFAETFAYLLLGPGSYHSRMAPPPSIDQVSELARFCRIERPHSSLLSPEMAASSK